LRLSRRLRSGESHTLLYRIEQTEGQVSSPRDLKRFVSVSYPLDEKVLEESRLLQFPDDCRPDRVTIREATTARRARRPVEPGEPGIVVDDGGCAHHTFTSLQPGLDYGLA
jgi:hypothetical protein